MKKVFAFVFARGGSKGLPRKNVLPLGGIPLVAHSIEVAKQLEGVDRIFVSTDDDEIKTSPASSVQRLLTAQRNWRVTMLPKLRLGATLFPI